MIADTDVLIDYFNDSQPTSEAVRAAFSRGTLATTAITRFELLVGSGSAEKRQAVLNLLGLLETLPLTAEAADRAAEVSRELASRGEALDRADCLIAGIALVAGEPLLTRNRSHFARVPGIRLADVGDEVNESLG